MIQPFDEGRKVINNIPMSVECLLLNGTAPQMRWGRPHYHEYIELLYPIKGDYQVDLNGETVDMPERSMFIINTCEPHTTLAVSPGERSLFCIKFMPQVLYSSEQTVTEMEYTIPYVFENMGQRRVFPEEILKNTFVPDAFNNIISEHAEKRFGYELAIRSEVLKVFAWIIRYWHDESEQGIPDISGSTAEAIVKARNYVNLNFADATLSEAADECNLSYSYFSRIFNKAMKMSFSDYVNTVRVNYSMKLLATTDQSITDIALSCGFSSTSYYIQTFRKLKNISPNKFRKMFK